MEPTQVCASPPRVTIPLVPLTLPSLNSSGKLKMSSPLILFSVPPSCDAVYAPPCTHEHSGKGQRVSAVFTEVKIGFSS